MVQRMIPRRVQMVALPLCFEYMHTAARVATTSPKTGLATPDLEDANRVALD